MSGYGTPGADPDYFGLVRIHLKPTSGHPIVYDSDASACCEVHKMLRFLADRTNVRAYATVLRLSSVVSMTLCIL